MKINIHEVRIKKRIRVDLGNIDALMESLNKYGLFHPITINNKMELISGFRRLESAKRLGWTYIEVKIVECDSREQLLERELEENVLRKDFTDDELQEGYLRLYKLQNPGFLTRLFRKIKKFFKKLFSKKNKTGL